MTNCSNILHNFLYELKPGWELISATKMVYEQEDTFHTLKKIENGKTVKVTLPPEDVEVDFFVHNKKLGINERVFVTIQK